MKPDCRMLFIALVVLFGTEAAAESPQEAAEQISRFNVAQQVSIPE